MKQVLKFLDTYKFWIIGGILALVVLPKIFKAMAGVGSGVTPGNTGAKPPKYICNPSAASRSKQFGVGTKNSSEVCYLQTWLNSYYGARLSVDGNFGNSTRSALDKFKPGAGIMMSIDSLGI